LQKFTILRKALVHTRHLAEWHLVEIACSYGMLQITLIVKYSVALTD